MEQKLKNVLAGLLASGPLALSVALAPPANASVMPAANEGGQDVAVRLAEVQKAVAEIEGHAPDTTPAAPNILLAWWGNVGFGLPGWGNGPRYGWRNGGWGNGYGWHNGGWRNGWHNGWHNY
jgi:rSAM-associated Gly-rich repeat protein